MEIFWSSPMPAHRGYNRRSTRAPPLPPRFAPPTIPRASRRRPLRRPSSAGRRCWPLRCWAGRRWRPTRPPRRPDFRCRSRGSAGGVGVSAPGRRPRDHNRLGRRCVRFRGAGRMAGRSRRPGIGQRHVGAVGVRGRRIGGVTRLRACRNDFACGVRGVGVGGGTDGRCGAAVVARRGDRAGPGRRVAGRVVGGAAAGRPALSAPDPVDGALTARTLTAHRRLTAAVVTAAGGTALGCLVTAVATPPSAASTAMLAAAAAILLLRMRVHASGGGRPHSRSVRHWCRPHCSARCSSARLACCPGCAECRPRLSWWESGWPLTRPGVRAGVCAGSHRPRSSPRRRPSRRWGVGRPACSARCVN